MNSERLSLYVVDDVSAPDLQLHFRPGDGAHCALFGWATDPEPVDDGPPAAVEEILAEALASVGPVAFLDARVPHGLSSGWQPFEGDEWLDLSPPLLKRVLGHRPVSLVATRRPERLRSLFSGEVSWTQQVQVAFLLRAGALPMITRELVERVVGARDAAIDELGLPGEVTALILPAVDGDYVELVARHPNERAVVRAAVEAECRRRGVPFGVRASWR